MRAIALPQGAGRHAHMCLSISSLMVEAAALGLRMCGAEAAGGFRVLLEKAKEALSKLIALPTFIFNRAASLSPLPPFPSPQRHQQQQQLQQHPSPPPFPRTCAPAAEPAASPPPPPPPSPPPPSTASASLASAAPFTSPGRRLSSSCFDNNQKPNQKRTLGQRCVCSSSGAAFATGLRFAC